VDVRPDTFNLDAASLARAVAVAKATGLKPACVIPVDLFGQPADADAIADVAHDHGLWVLSDAAQSYGATWRGTRVGVFGKATATSFYPSKPLGCYGDGGAVFTDDDEMYKRLVQVRVHGQGRDRNDTARIGLTARFDSIQAAVLLEKLAIFDDECVRRQAVAERYTAGLRDVVQTPVMVAGATSVWAQYTIRSPRRDRIVATLGAKQIPTAVFYPRPIHTQTPYRGFPKDDGLPVTEQLAQDVVSLPMHPYLSADDQDRVIAAVHAALS
jgi:dTDP-4-amino-4,6-dideoxygalactose transaminase